MTFVEGARATAELHGRILTPGLGLAYAVALALLCGSAGAQDTAAAGGGAISIEPSPFLSLGVVAGDPDEEFFQVRTPFMTPRGRVVVPLNGSGEIRVFSLSGDLLETFGRRGEGPGEFRELTRVWARGDTLEAWDGALRRITRFLPDGTNQVVNFRELARASVVIPGSLRDGWAVETLTSPGYGERDEIVIGSYAADGSFIRAIARTRGMLRYMDVAHRWAGPSPLSPSAMWALRDNVVYVGETLTPRIERFDADGAELGAITWDAAERPTPEQAFRAIRGLAVQRASPSSRQRVQLRMQDPLLPKQVPVFTTFLVDALGFVWIRPYIPSRDAVAVGGALYDAPVVGGTWWVFGPRGESVGSVVIPDELEPSYIGADALVGVHRDEMGVEFVQVYRVRRN